MTILPEPNNSINRFRQRLSQFIESPRITRIITVLIVINAITLGLETSSIAMERIGSLLLITDKVLLTIFAVELCIKLFAFGWRFFTTGWNIFDFVIIGIALVPSSGNLSVLRSLRILRGLRLITYIPSMRRVVAALMASIPGISSVIALMALVYYIFGVMVTKLFGEVFPAWFGTIGKSMYSLFQIMTLESWSMGIVRPVMEVFPYAWIVFVPFILITSFAVINLFIAVIVNAMTEQGKLDSVDPGQDQDSFSEYEHQALVNKIEDLKEQLDAIKVIVAKR